LKIFYLALSVASALKSKPVIAHQKYTELLSKIIWKTITSKEQAQVEEFEKAQPRFCPRCKRAVWTMLEPHRVAHDIENCSVNS